MTPEVEKLLGQRAHIRATCQAEMLNHFFEVSRSMPPEQGKRYLVWVREKTCLRERPMDHGPDSRGLIRRLTELIKIRATRKRP